MAGRFNNPHLVTALRVYALWIGFSVAAQYFVQLMYALERIGPAIVYNLVGTQIAQILLLVAAFYFELGLLPYLWCLVSLEGVKAVVAFIVTWRCLGGLSWRPNRDTVGRQLGYAMPLAVVQAVNRLSYDIDLLIVSSTYAMQDSVPIFRVDLLLIPLSCAAFNILIQTTGRTRPVMVLSLLYIVLSIPLNFIFIHWLGLIGPAVATVLCKIGLATAQLRVVTQRYRRSLPDIYPFRQVGGILVVSAVAIVPVAALARLIPHPLAQFAVAAGLALPVYLIAFWRCRILRDADLAPVRKWIRLPSLLKF